MNKDLKVLVTGAKGQLGYDCVRELHERGYSNVLGVDIDDFDITKKDDVLAYVKKYKPDIIMHNAAWTAVDKAELNPETVYKVNSFGTKYIAEACACVGAKLMYISTDYVFDGSGDNFYEINDKKNGLSVYGKSKSQGEDFIITTLKNYFIIRISWVFGLNGNNFVKTMLNLANNGKVELNVVCDQIGSPTYTYDLSKLMCDMMETDKYGIYHATNEGECSWAEFAKYIFEITNKKVKVNPITTEQYTALVNNQAKRPLNSRLSKKSLDQNGFCRLPDWKNAVERYIMIVENKSF